MKNLIIALSVLFTVSLNAQVKKAPAKTAVKTEATKQVSTVKEKLSVEQAAKKDIDALAAFVSLSEERKFHFRGLFETKHRMLTSDSPEGLTPETKASVSKMIEGKFESSIDKESFEKIKANKPLFYQLMN